MNNFILPFAVTLTAFVIGVGVGLLMARALVIIPLTLKAQRAVSFIRWVANYSGDVVTERNARVTLRDIGEEP